MTTNRHFIASAGCADFPTASSQYRIFSNCHGVFGRVHFRLPRHQRALDRHLFDDPLTASSYHICQTEYSTTRLWQSSLRSARRLLAWSHRGTGPTTSKRRLSKESLKAFGGKLIFHGLKFPICRVFPLHLAKSNAVSIISQNWGRRQADRR